MVGFAIWLVSAYICCVFWFLVLAVIGKFISGVLEFIFSKNFLKLLLWALLIGVISLTVIAYLGPPTPN